MRQPQTVTVFWTPSIGKTPAHLLMKTSSATEPVNMTKEYRAELKELRGRARALKKDAATVTRDAEREINRIVREANKMLAGIAKEVEAIDKRRLVLEGRLGK